MRLKYMGWNIHMYIHIYFYHVGVYVPVWHKGDHPDIFTDVAVILYPGVPFTNMD